MQREDRRNFFSQIAARLCPNGYLISSDLSANTSTATYQSFLEVWLGLFQMPAEQLEKMCPVFGQNVAVLPSIEVESIIAASGFDQPVLFFQTLLLHAWYAKRTSLN
jgi:tRNA (cmo5U34)-methyltransferase